MSRFTVLFFVLSAGLLPTGASAEEVAIPVFRDDFEAGFDRWSTTDQTKKVWENPLVKKPSDGEDNHVLRVTGPSDYQPPFRSPHSIALVKDLYVSDFELTVKLQNTRPDAGNHRDLCIFWGYQDPAHYYYVHLGAKPDPHACQIFIVNSAARAMITKDQAVGTPWTNGWHTVKIVRKVADGTMSVYFDDMTKPLMTAVDTTFLWGQVGLGTFDDHGNFDDFQITGTRVPKGKTP